MEYGRISPTALMTALGRQLSGLPHTTEMAERLLAHHLGVLPLLLEARHRALDRLLKKERATQILEIASGFLTRGLTMTEDPNVLFVESDLPEVAASKRALLLQLAPGRPNLKVLDLDATAQPNPLLPIQSEFQGDKPIHVICEGLLMYLNFEEKARVCQNVREFLGPQDTWMTSDFASTAGLRQATHLDDNTERRLQRLTETTGRSLRENSFESLEQARQFVTDQGFRVEEYPLTEIRHELQSISKLSVTEEMVDKVLASPGQTVFKLTPPQKTR